MYVGEVRMHNQSWREVSRPLESQDRIISMMRLMLHGSGVLDSDLSTAHRTLSQGLPLDCPDGRSYRIRAL